LVSIVESDIGSITDYSAGTVTQFTLKSASGAVQAVFGANLGWRSRSVSAMCVATKTNLGVHLLDAYHSAGSRQLQQACQRRPSSAPAKLLRMCLQEKEDRRMALGDRPLGPIRRRIDVSTAQMECRERERCSVRRTGLELLQNLLCPSHVAIGVTRRGEQSFG
jgi:hypothetical protein